MTPEKLETWPGVFLDSKEQTVSKFVTRGQKSKIFNIGQITYQNEGNSTGNLMHSFLAPPRSPRGRVGNGYRVLRIPDEYLVIPGYWVRVRVSISEVFVR